MVPRRVWADSADEAGGKRLRAREEEGVGQKENKRKRRIGGNNKRGRIGERKTLE